MIPRLLTLLLLCIGPACNDIGTSPGEYQPTLHDRPFNILVRYGVDARNELNTFYDTFTKDLIAAGSATTRLVLSDTDLDSIRTRVAEIDLFSYPDTFVVPSVNDTVIMVSPHYTYLVQMKVGTSQKSVFWRDSIISSNTRATNFRQLITYICKLVEAYPEYKSLPEPTGYYI